MEELFIRYMHFVGIISMFSLLAIQNILLLKKINIGDFKKLGIIDGLYGFSAVVTLIAGLMLWLVVGKPSEFYSVNIIFQLKLTLFGFVGLISIAPTIYFIRNRNSKEREINVPSWVIRIKRTELIVLLLIPLLAVLMARGVGLN